MLTTANNDTTNNNDAQNKLRAKCATRRAVVQRLVQVIKAAVVADDGSNNKHRRSVRHDDLTDMDIDDKDSSDDKLQEVWCEYSPPDPSVLMIKKDGRVLVKDQPMCLVVRLFIKNLESFVDAWIAKSGPLIEEMKAITSACDKRCVILHDADDRKITRVLFCCA